MNKKVLVTGAIIAGVGYVVFDSLKIKRHWYLPAAIDAQYNAMNAVRKSLVTMQTADSMIAHMRAGDSTPLEVIATLTALDENR